MAERATGSGLGPASRVLLTLAAAAIAVVGLSLARDFVIPIALAAVIVIVVHPLRGRVLRAGGPSWLGTTVVIATAYAILAVLGVLLVVAIVQFAELVPSYAGDLADAVAELRDTLVGWGLDPATVEQQLATADPESLAHGMLAAVSGILGWAVAFFFVLAYILFAAVDSARYHELARRFADSRGRTIAALRGFTRGVRRYMVVNAVFGVVVAVLDGALLVIMGIPGALVWAVLAFVTNFIPNIGFVIGVIPPLVLALVTGGWAQALIVLAAYCVINFTLQELVQPKFVSDAVGLSLTLTFASVIFWTMVIGPIGAILAVPLTLFVRTLLLDADPEAGWARALSGADPEPPPTPDA